MKEHILEIARRLHSKNMLAAADGNISYRLSDQEIWITPAGRSKAFLDAKDLACVTLNNQIVSGQPSSERLMHLAIFQSCPVAKAVVHAHPVTAIAFSVARPHLSELPANCLSEVILACGRIPFVDYARPGTDQMGQVLRPFLPDHRALILRGHGAVAWGETLDEAYNGMERIEHSAQILFAAHALGGAQDLPETEIIHLKKMRERIGPQIL